MAVLGFNAQATDTAHYLIAQGKKVTVIAPEPAEAFGAELEAHSEADLQTLLDQFVSQVTAQ